MKKMFTLAVLMTIAISATAMNRKQAREEAYMTTNRMAHVLDLSKRQYDRVFHINMSYFRKLDGRNDYRDAEVRNRELARVLTPRQMDRFYSMYAGRGSHSRTWRDTGNHSYSGSHHDSHNSGHRGGGRH